MESEINVEVKIGVDFDNDEMKLLRKAASQDYNEPRFDKIPEEMSFEDIEHLREVVGLTIEWGDYDNPLPASKLYGELDSLMVKIEKGAY